MTTAHTMDSTQAEQEAAFIAEAHERFLLVFAACDWLTLVRIIDVSRFHFLKYSKMRDACKMVYIVLWYHALLRSFPSQCSEMLDYFIKENLPRFYSRRRVVFLEAQIRHLLDAMREKGDGDFTVIAKYLLELANPSQSTADPLQSKDMAVKQLKLVLHLRTEYDVLFNHLI